MWPGLDDLDPYLADRRIVARLRDLTHSRARAAPVRRRQAGDRSQAVSNADTFDTAHLIVTCLFIKWHSCCRTTLSVPILLSAESVIS
jgi:hypothetical protein